jgi:hypothetical protein
MSSARAARWLIAAALLVLAVPAAAAASITVVSPPNPGTSNTLGGLAALAPTDIWGVGTSSSPTYNCCQGRTLTIRSNAGGAFAEVPETPAATPICASVVAVAARSASDIWAVGSSNSARDPHVRHWNGSTWTAGPGGIIPVPPSGGRRLHSTGLNGVAAVPGSTDVWAVGGAEFADFSRHALIERWTPNGGWELIAGPTATGSVFNGVAALGASDVWAVGSTGGIGGQTTLAAHYDGTSWSTVATPNANTINKLNAVSAAGASDVWAVGSAIKSTTDGVSQYRTLIEHFNGASWSTVPSPNVGAASNELTGVAARSANDVWAVGYRIDASGQIPVAKTLWMHWNGTRWSVVTSANAGSGDNLLAGVIAPAGSNNAWAWGSAGGALIERFTP